MNQHPFHAKLDYAHREIRLLTILDDDDDYLIRYTTRTASLDGRPNFTHGLHDITVASICKQ
jgi:hypothetical protein